jgi:hypothetical protein
MVLRNNETFEKIRKTFRNFVMKYCFFFVHQLEMEIMDKNCRVPVHRTRHLCLALRVRHSSQIRILQFTSLLLNQSKNSFNKKGIKK